jgi:hypothetical protein
MAARTDLTQDIDGAFAQRNVGNKHWSECARSGNGNMMTDLRSEDSVDYQEYDGVGETMEALTPEESASVDGLGQLAAFPKFRWPKAGEVPPVAAGQGKAWLRRRVVTGTRLPGGARMAKVKWVQVNKSKLNSLTNSGQIHGMGEFSTMGIAGSVGIGLVGGLVLWMGIRALRRK